MIKGFTLILLALITVLPATAQTFIIKGRVTDKETGKAVPAASVFLSNTSIGTAADDKGNFTLHSIPPGKFDLVVSSLGYETYVQTISADKVTEPLAITLTAKANELASVRIGTYDKDGWATWGKTFIGDFVGTSSNAENCEIKNDTVIKFHYSKKKNFLEAFADEPLIIENRSLGYIIHYKLENFSHDFENNTISYEGFPLFEQMQGNARKLKKWNESRKDAYYGSIIHFMRCLYINKLLENGYEVKRLERKENFEKKRIQALYKYLAGADGNVDFESQLPGDSLKYYQKILKQPNATDILHNEVLPGDSIAYGGDSVTAVLAFNDYLQITYKNKKEPQEYRDHLRTPDSPSGYITSLATLINHRPVFVASNGAYYQPQDILTSGFWAWSDKACNMLPFDYWP